MSLTRLSRTDIFIMTATVIKPNSKMKQETHADTHTQTKTKVHWVLMLGKQAVAEASVRHLKLVPKIADNVLVGFS